MSQIFGKQIKPPYYLSGSMILSGSIFALQFIGDGSGLTNLPIQNINTASLVNTSSFNAFTSSYNTGSFTGSFVGDGSGLINLPVANINTASLVSTSSFNAFTSSYNTFTGSYYQDSASFESTFNKTDDYNISSSVNYASSKALSDGLKHASTSSFGITLDGLGGVISTGGKGYVVAAYDCSIQRWDLIGDVSGSIVVDVKRGGTSIIGAGNKPTLSSQIINGEVVSGWTSTNITQGDFLEFNVDSASTLTRVNLSIRVNKI